MRTDRNIYFITFPSRLGRNEKYVFIYRPPESCAYRVCNDLPPNRRAVGFRIYRRYTVEIGTVYVDATYGRQCNRLNFAPMKHDVSNVCELYMFLLMIGYFIYF